MAHSVENISELHIDAQNLLNNVVFGTADTILNDLNSGIEELKASWKGTDAGKNIDDLITVYNGVATFRNELAKLAKAVADIAVDYDRLQVEHGGVSSNLAPLDYSDRSLKDSYSDNFTGIDINEGAVSGKEHVDSAKNVYESFKEEASAAFNKIMDNWTAGSGREDAEGAFNTFNSKAGEYTSILTTVSSNVTTVLQNYQII